MARAKTGDEDMWHFRLDNDKALPALYTNIFLKLTFNKASTIF